MNINRISSGSRLHAAYVGISIALGSVAPACANSDDFTDAEVRVLDKVIGVTSAGVSRASFLAGFQT
jgi:hypothetical protein